MYADKWIENPHILDHLLFSDSQQSVYLVGIAEATKHKTVIGYFILLSHCCNGRVKRDRMSVMQCLEQKAKDR